MHEQTCQLVSIFEDGELIYQFVTTQGGNKNTFRLILTGWVSKVYAVQNPKLSVSYHSTEPNLLDFRFFHQELATTFTFNVVLQSLPFLN